MPHDSPCRGVYSRERHSKSPKMKKLILLFAAALLAALPACAQVNVSLSPTPRQYFIDANGNPCAGCYVFTYQAGTMTPQATYLDSTGTVQNPNPIVLDSMGSAPVWLGPWSYKLVLETAGGSPIWTVDGIKPNDSLYLRLDGTNGPVTGALTFSGVITLSGGGALAGTWTGSPFFSGDPTFTGNPHFTGLPTFNSFTSNTANPASTGALRLSKSDKVCWRNDANTGDICLQKNAGDDVQIPSIASAADHPAATGYIKLASGDEACWRNAANSGDICVSKDSNDDLLYNGHQVATPQGQIGAIYIATSPVSVSNTTAETPLQTVSYKTGDINVTGRTLHVVCGFAVNNGSASSTTFTYKLYVGSTLFGTATETITAGLSNVYTTIEFWSTVTSAGASGTLEWQFAEGANRFLTGSSANGSGTTFDTTGGQPIKLTVTMGAADPAISATQRLMLAKIQ